MPTTILFFDLTYDRKCYLCFWLAYSLHACWNSWWTM